MGLQPFYLIISVLLIYTRMDSSDVADVFYIYVVGAPYNPGSHFLHWYYTKIRDKVTNMSLVGLTQSS